MIDFSPSSEARMAPVKGPHIHIVLRMAEEVDDPRDPRGVRHLLVDILVISLLALLCGCDNPEEFEEYGEEQEEWLRTFLELPHGIPSHYTITRVLAMLSPRAFERFFVRWVESLGWEPGPRHIAIDGKTVRGSFDKAAGIKGIHMVGAWLREHDLVLGQVKTGEKSNEITAIPELMKMLDLRDATVTIDAMGCQKHIAEAIRGHKAHYVLAVKDNQPTLHEQTAAFFTDALRTDRAKEDGPAPVLDHVAEADKGHGRTEEREAWVSHDLSWLDGRKEWAGLAGIGMVRSKRTQNASGKTSEDTRYYIVSNPALTAEELHRLVRGHWGIENKVHWTLDVAFREDYSRIRLQNAARNLAVLRRLALNLIRKAPSKKRRSVKTKRLRCAWNREYLLTVLGVKPAEVREE